jgi:hypothetical protein
MKKWWSNTSHYSCSMKDLLGFWFLKRCVKSQLFERVSYSVRWCKPCYPSFFRLRVWSLFFAKVVGNNGLCIVWFVLRKRGLVQVVSSGHPSSRDLSWEGCSVLFQFQRSATSATGWATSPGSVEKTRTIATWVLSRQVELVDRQRPLWLTWFDVSAFLRRGSAVVISEVWDEFHDCFVLALWWRRAHRQGLW